MIKVLRCNLSETPIDIYGRVSYKNLKKALEDITRANNIPVEITEDRYGVGDGSWFGLNAGATPCIAIYHTHHKKDYYTIIVELKEAYNKQYAYIHMGGTSKNKQNINMGNSYTFLRTDGEIGQHRPGWLGNAISNKATANMQDEELYYRAVYKCIGSALVTAESMATNPPPKASQPTHTPQSGNNTPPSQNKELKKQPKSAFSEELHSFNSGNKLIESIGVETMGQIFTVVIPAGTNLPARISKIFSTAKDNQPSVEIHVLQGGAEKACDNVSLGKYKVDGIPLQARGIPQIEVTFCVDEHGKFDMIAQIKDTDKMLKVSVGEIVASKQKEKLQQQAKTAQPQKSAPIASCRISSGKSDKDQINWTEANVGFVTVDGACACAIEKKTYIPVCKELTLSFNVDDCSSTEIKVIESTGTAAENNQTIGKFVLSKIPFLLYQQLEIELHLNVDTTGLMFVTAKHVMSGKFLPITFVPEQTNACPPAKISSAQVSKNKVEQIKELTDLLERGAISKQEFEDLKKSIIYN